MNNCRFMDETKHTTTFCGLTKDVCDGNKICPLWELIRINKDIAEMLKTKLEVK